MPEGPEIRRAFPITRGERWMTTTITARYSVSRCLTVKENRASAVGTLSCASCSRRARFSGVHIASSET